MSTSLRARRRRSDRPKKHTLLLGAREHFDHARESYREEYVRPFKRNLVDLCVSKEVLSRALEAANELFLALEDRGQRVVLAPPDRRYRHVPCEPRVGSEKRAGEHEYYAPSMWTPGRPTLTFIGDVAIGLTLFEVREEVDARFDSKTNKYVRVVTLPSAVAKLLGNRTAAPAYQGWISKHWLATGRLGLHAYAPYERVEWQRYWLESAPGKFSAQLATIGKELEEAAPRVTELVAEEARRAEERRQKWEAELVVIRQRQAEEERKREEQRRHDEEKRREKELADSIGRWRLARDIRAYVHEAHHLVADAKLSITEGGGLDLHLKWALAYAERVDPQTGLRDDIARVAAERVGDPVRADGSAPGQHPASARSGAPAEAAKAAES